jgi:hypothetical protein
MFLRTMYNGSNGRGHMVKYMVLRTMYNGSNGRRGRRPHLKAGRANGRTAHGRSSLLGTRPLPASYGGLAAGKTTQGLAVGHNNWRIKGEPTCDKSGGGRCTLRRGDRAAVRRGKQFGGCFAYMPLVRRSKWGKRRTRADVARCPSQNTSDRRIKFFRRPVKFELIRMATIRMRQTAVLGFPKSLSPTGLHCLRADRVQQPNLIRRVATHH